MDKNATPFSKAAQAASQKDKYLNEGAVFETGFMGFRKNQVLDYINYLAEKSKARSAEYDEQIAKLETKLEICKEETQHVVMRAVALQQNLNGEMAEKQALAGSVQKMRDDIDGLRKTAFVREQELLKLKNENERLAKSLDAADAEVVEGKKKLASVYSKMQEKTAAQAAERSYWENALKPAKTLEVTAKAAKDVENVEQMLLNMRYELTEVEGKIEGVLNALKSAVLQMEHAADGNGHFAVKRASAYDFDKDIFANEALNTQGKAFDNYSIEPNEQADLGLEQSSAPTVRVRAVKARTQKQSNIIDALTKYFT